MAKFKLTLQAYGGKLLIWVGRMVINCLISLAIKKVKESKGGINMANPFWSAMGQIALAGIASYGSSKLANSQTSWAPFRDQMLKTMTTAALSVAAAQIAQATSEKAQDPMQKAVGDMVAAETQSLAQKPEVILEGTDKVIDKVKAEAEKVIKK